MNDIICMFNPGLGFSLSRIANGPDSDPGESKLQFQSLSTWLPTIQLLLLSLKPIIVTAHGMKDYSRDVKVWNDVVSDINRANSSPHEKYILSWLLQPAMGLTSSNDFNSSNNPFKSFWHEVDEHDHEQPIITPNAVVYALQLKKVC
jgi:hypothetical protein